MQKEIIVDNLLSIWQEKEITKPLPAEGRSMYPLIKHGDTIHIKFCNPEKVKVGDIIAFRRNDTTIVHRLLEKIDSKSFLEKGDLQLKAQYIEANNILGKVLLGNPIINCFMSFLGNLIQRICNKQKKPKSIGKLLLIFPFAINIVSRIIYKYVRRSRRYI